jgi:DNA primase
VVRAAEGDRHFDRFRRRIIFPIVNESGKLVAFGGRALGDDQPKYLNSPETPIYTKSRVLYHLDRAGGAIRRLDRAILVEGYMDCIAVASAGFENVVASCGTSLTESQVRLLGRYSRRVVVNYDPDSAGLAATERSLARLLEESFRAQVLALPGGLDPDSFIRRQGAESYRGLLNAAPSYLDFLMERAASQHDLAAPEGKVAAANAVIPFVAKISNGLARQEWVNRLAERFRLDGPLLLQELRRSAGPGVKPGPASRVQGLRPRATEAEKHLLRAILEADEVAGQFLPRLLNEPGCRGLATERIFAEIAALRRAGEKVELTRLEKQLSDDEKQTLYESMLASWERPSDPQLEEFLSTIKRRGLKQEREDLRSAIKTAEREGNRSKLADLLSAKLKVEKELARLSAKAKAGPNQGEGPEHGRPAP